MKLTEANIVLLFVLLSPHRSNFAKDFSSNVRIHESIFLTSFMRRLQRCVKFWLRRKKCIIDSDS